MKQNCKYKIAFYCLAVLLINSGCVSLLFKPYSIPIGGVIDFRIKEYKVPSHILVLSGKCPDSSLGYREPKLTTAGRNVYVTVQKDAVRQYVPNGTLSAVFSISIPITSSTEQIYFGSNEALVWSN